jgi:phosphoglycerol transferase MdoB-like AlkP superfamily enzyme
MLIIILPLYFFDLGLYSFWKFRLDYSIFEYSSTPMDMLASLSNFQIVLFIILFGGGLYLIRKFLYNTLVSPVLGQIKTKSYLSAVIVLLILPFLFIPIRGGLSTSPVNTGSVYFHKSVFYNHVAINPVWNFFYSYTEKDKLNIHPDFFEDEYAKKLVNKLYYNPSETREILLNNRPNIVLIIMESFSSYFIHKTYKGIEVIPNLDTQIEKGIFFPNFFASSYRSDRGLAAILSGYPSPPRVCILHYENKSEDLPSLAHSLSEAGYHSKFFYGGDIDFAHIKSYLINTGFNKIISDKDFPSETKQCKWGTPDQYVFERVFQEIQNDSGPFFYAFFTLSTHNPYDIPGKKKFPGSLKDDKVYSSMFYTDSCLGDFIEKVKRSDVWNNTLIIITADHGVMVPGCPIYDKERFRIPLLWTGGALKATPEKISEYCSQTDMATSILKQMSLNADQYLYGKDMFQEEPSSFAFYIPKYYCGMITENSYQVFSLEANKYVENIIEMNPGDVSRGQNENTFFSKYPLIVGDTIFTDMCKAYLQVIYTDYNNR